MPAVGGVDLASHATTPAARDRYLKAKTISLEKQHTNELIPSMGLEGI